MRYKQGIDWTLVALTMWGEKTEGGEGIKEALKRVVTTIPRTFFVPGKWRSGLIIPCIRIIIYYLQYTRKLCKTE